MKRLHLRARRSTWRPPLAAIGQPGAKFIAGGTNLLDLMKLEVETPAHLVDISAPAARPDRGDAGRRPAHRRAGDATATLAADRARARALSAAGAGAPGRRLGAAAQHGDHRRQPAAAHALPLLLRHRRRPATSARRAAAARRCGGFNRIHAILGASDACIAAASVGHGGGAARARCRGRDRMRRDGRRAASRSPTSTACPATRRSIETDLGAGRADHRRDPAAAARRAGRSIARCATAPPTPSRWSRSRRSSTLDGERDPHARARARRRGAQAVARARGRAAARRRAAADDAFAAAGEAAVQGRAGPRPQRLQDPARRAHRRVAR